MFYITSVLVLVSVRCFEFGTQTANGRPALRKILSYFGSVWRKLGSTATGMTTTPPPAARVGKSSCPVLAFLSMIAKASRVVQGVDAERRYRLGRDLQRPTGF